MAAQLLTIGLVPPLIWIEIQYPEFIYQHPNNQLLMIDLFVTYAIVSVILLLLMKSNAEHFKLEQAKSDSLSEQLRILSEHDSLTGLFNRRILDQDFSYWQEEKHPFCLAILDIDYFKRVNDQWGHAYGDNVLVLFADLLKVHAAKTQSLPIRLGGEEFVLLLPMTCQEAKQNLQELADQLANVGFDHDKITFSAGITQVEKHFTQIDALKQADILLYQAKNNGRNCIMSSHQQSDYEYKPTNF
ncbi:hypothetical protein GCM10027340_01600 [Marinomonas epiphytica]